MLDSPERPSSPVSKVTRLSKSKFLSGLQCQKRLYLEIHSPDLATPPDEETRAILDMGTMVGEVARQRYPGGVLVDVGHRNRQEALRRTAELVNDPAVPAIFEGAFEFDQVLIRVDILERIARAEDGTAVWRLVEVKSSARTKDVHLEDLALQTFVLDGAGVSVAESCLMHLNTQYVYPGGDLDLTSLFVLRDLTSDVRAKLVGVPARVSEMKRMLLVPLPPDIEPDGHCHMPYECPFWDHCTKEKPERWVYYLPGGARAVQQLVSQGIETIEDIPSAFKLTPVQHRVKENVEWVSPRLKGALQTVRYPVHHLDFETFMPAIPKFPATRPYQAIPTQWSNHIEINTGDVRHEEYLCSEPTDPREELAVALLESVGKEGSICVYSGYERAVLERLAEALPSLQKELKAMIRRLWDLFTVVRDHYYHPEFKGSFSIKAVLPALVPELTYRDLEIQEGGIAAHLYGRMVFQETDWVEKARLREALLKYCERDTLALVHIRRVLHSKAVANRDA